jgi:hypothetical protein
VTEFGALSNLFREGSYLVTITDDFVESYVCRNPRDCHNRCSDLAKKTQPQLYIPFAGSFIAAHPSDHCIRANNLHGSRAIKHAQSPNFHYNLPAAGGQHLSVILGRGGCRTALRPSSVRPPTRSPECGRPAVRILFGGSSRPVWIAPGHLLRDGKPGHAAKSCRAGSRGIRRRPGRGVRNDFYAVLRNS